MKNLFLEGGAAFMGILTLLFIIMCAWFLYHFFRSISSMQISSNKSLHLLKYGTSIGLLALITGILGQLVGFTSMFDAMQAAVGRGEEIIPGLVFGGIRATMIVTIYGLIIYIISIILWFISSYIIERKFKMV